MEEEWPLFDDIGPLPLAETAVATPVFEPGTQIELWGDAGSMVWQRNTLYTPAIRQPMGVDKKTREWVKWRYHGHSLAAFETLPVILRASEWLPHTEKFKLVAQTHSQTPGGWRTFLIQLSAVPVKRAKVESETTVDADRISVRGPSGQIITLQQALDMMWLREK